MPRIPCFVHIMELGVEFPRFLGEIVAGKRFNKNNHPAYIPSLLSEILTPDRKRCHALNWCDFAPCGDMR